MKAVLIPVAFVVIVLPACSSIISRSEYSVSINSHPDSADFVVTNRSGQKVHSGKTPSSVTLESSAGYFRGEAYTVELNKEGYAAKTYTLRSGLDGWYWGNILLGGIIGMLIVDPLTGAMYTLPERVDVTLDPQSALNLGTRDIIFATIDSLPPSLVSRLERVQQE